MNASQYFPIKFYIHYKKGKYVKENVYFGIFLIIFTMPVNIMRDWVTAMGFGPATT